MRLVIDSNSLSSDRLAEFLAESKSNFAIITDYAWMEAYKANSIPVLKKSMSVLGRYQEQVLHLWGTKKISGMDFRGAALGDMMVRKRAAKDFRELVQNLERLDEVGPLPLSKITAHVEAARSHIEGRLLRNMEESREAYPEMQTFFTKQEIAAIRSNAPHSPEIMGKIMFLVGKSSERLAKRHPAKPRGPTPKSYYNTFIFRYSLASIIYFIDWIREGSQPNKKASLFRNDLIDISFAVYGTYFNGIMSKDKKLIRYYAELSVALEYLGARIPVDASRI